MDQIRMECSGNFSQTLAGSISGQKKALFRKCQIQNFYGI